VLEGHTDWVRDVSWAPNIGLARSYIASAGQDKAVLIHTQDSPRSPWASTPLSSSASGGAKPFADVVWRTSWSVSGNVLAVSVGDGKVSLWKENLKGVWECVSEVEGGSGGVGGSGSAGVAGGMGPPMGAAAVGGGSGGGSVAGK
jgi:protein transport protein SEC13